MSAILSDAVMKAFVAAGLITDEENATRLVLGLQAGKVPVMHVQRIGDKRLLAVVPSLEGVEIRREEPADAPQYEATAKVIEDGYAALLAEKFPPPVGQLT